MVFDLSILQSDIANPTTRDLILSALVQNRPLSAIKIYNHVKKKKNIRYSTVYTAIKELVARGIIAKNEKGYTMSITWINKLKHFVNIAERVHFKRSPFFEQMEITNEDNYTISGRFKSMADFNDFMFRFMSEEKKSVYSMSNHLWFPLFHPKEVLELANTLKTNQARISAVSANSTAVDEYCKNYIDSTGGVASIGKQTAENIGLFVFGNKIVQIMYPKHIVEKINSTFKKSKKLDTVLTPEFLKETLYKKIKLPVIVVESKEISELLKQNVENIITGA